MDKEINTETVIKAKTEEVWAVLTDFDNYQKWNPFIKLIKGQMVVGNRITVRLEPPGSSGMNIRPKVLAFVVNKEFRWIGHLLIPGLFDGDHRFELVDNKNGTTTFRQSEKFKGILIPLFKKMLDINTTNGFRQMNEKLKNIVEQK
jgi:hypothetical protein